MLKFALLTTYFQKNLDYIDVFQFSVEPYVMTKDYADQLRYRMSLFKAETHTRKGLAVTMVTTYGVLPGKNSGVVNTEVTLDDLFAMPAT